MNINRLMTLGKHLEVSQNVEENTCKSMKKLCKSMYQGYFNTFEIYVSMRQIVYCSQF